MYNNGFWAAAGRYCAATPVRAANARSNALAIVVTGLQARLHSADEQMQHLLNGARL